MQNMYSVSLMGFHSPKQHIKVCIAKHTHTANHTKTISTLNTERREKLEDDVFAANVLDFIGRTVHSLSQSD